MPKYFGVRHLSPNGAFNIVHELDKLKPELVLIESPSDFTSFIPEFSNQGVTPPFAVLAFTNEKPIKTVILPLAVYSPEYQAVLWCNKNGVECRFIDLPSTVTIGLGDALEQKRLAELEALENEDDDDIDDVVDDAEEIVEEYIPSVYDVLDKKYGSYEIFWESYIEHAKTDYFGAVNNYGAGLREFDRSNDYDFAMNYVRESYMKMNIEEAVKSAKDSEKIAVITGSFHTEGLKNDDVKAMTAKELKSLPKVQTDITLMPYSYFKLSKQSGYGAGNNAPNYYHMLWEQINAGTLENVGIEYLTSIAREMRNGGHNASSAQVIDAMHLAKSLATLQNRPYPVLADLQDACVSCFGEGEMGSIAMSRTKVEIGTTIGKLPDGLSNTSIQQDFKTNLKDLKLDQYLSLTASEVSLDLRENIHVKTEKSAYLDLNRSFFLHRLQVLGIHFCGQIHHTQDSASYREKWNLQWSTEVEIELIEGSLLGDSIEKATIQKMKNSIEENPNISNITEQILRSFLCGLPQALAEFIVIFQMETIDSKDFLGFAKCISHLMSIVTYGSLRKIDTKNIELILENLYTKVVLMVEDNVDCDDSQVKEMMSAFDTIDNLTIELKSINPNPWYEILATLTDRLTINQFLSGYATALLLEKGFFSPFDIENKIIFHLSSSIDGKITANWLEGLCMKNRYQLILNLNVWRYFDDYLKTLDLEQFKRVLLFFRRAFTRFSIMEKESIVDNLKEIWGVNINNSDVNDQISKEELEEFSAIDDDFDFDDI